MNPKPSVIRAGPVLSVLVAIAKAFGNVHLTPTAFLIDKQGLILNRTVGEPDFEALRAAIASELI